MNPEIVFSVRHRYVLTHIVGGSDQNRSVIANVQSDDLWPSRMDAATHILQEKIRACGILKRHNFRVHASLGSAETLVRRGGIINRLTWVESIVCNISIVFLRHSVQTEKLIARASCHVTCM